MRTFIYSYEAKLLDYLNSLVPEVKEITYAKKEDLFPAISQVKKFPAVYYTRSTSDVWSLPRKYDFAEEYLNSEGVPELMRSQVAIIEQHYSMYIYVENVAQAMSLSSLLKFKWNPYLDVPWEFTKRYLWNRVTTDETVPVGMRLLGVRVDEDRSPSDKLGSQRVVELRWTSQIFQWYTDKEPDDGSLVEEVHFFFGDKEVLMTDGVLDQTKVFSIIPKAEHQPITPPEVRHISVRGNPTPINCQWTGSPYQSSGWRVVTADQDIDWNKVQCRYIPSVSGVDVGYYSEDLDLSQFYYEDPDVQVEFQQTAPVELRIIKRRSMEIYVYPAGKTMAYTGQPITFDNYWTANAYPSVAWHPELFHGINTAVQHTELGTYNDPLSDDMFVYDAVDQIENIMIVTMDDTVTNTISSQRTDQLGISYPLYNVDAVQPIDRKFVFTDTDYEELQASIGFEFAVVEQRLFHGWEEDEETLDTYSAGHPLNFSSVDNRNYWAYVRIKMPTQVPIEQLNSAVEAVFDRCMTPV